jgi:hypothetical protein
MIFAPEPCGGGGAVQKIAWPLRLALGRTGS